MYLLPCPFCGTEPEWINEAVPDGHYYIRCPHCHIVMKEDRRDKVVGMWNTRKGLKDYLPDHCVLDIDIKYCHHRQGDGNMCKLCC
jgi:hypothetical protein